MASSVLSHALTAISRAWCSAAIGDGHRVHRVAVMAQLDQMARLLLRRGELEADGRRVSRASRAGCPVSASELALVCVFAPVRSGQPPRPGLRRRASHRPFFSYGCWSAGQNHSATKNAEHDRNKQPSSDHYFVPCRAAHGPSQLHFLYSRCLARRAPGRQRMRTKCVQSLRVISHLVGPANITRTCRRDRGNGGEVGTDASGGGRGSR